jgi:hypothetical protein
MRLIQPQIDYSSAREFLDALSPLGSYFGAASSNEPWLFRGQGQDVTLIPSAFRMNGKKDKLATLTNRDINKFEERVRAERDVLTCPHFEYHLTG